MKKIIKTHLNSEWIIGIIMMIVFMIMPAFLSAYQISTNTSFLFTIIMGFSIVLIWGYCGTFSFGQAAFYGLGGYTYGILAGNFGNHALTPLALLISLVLVTVFALILGYFMFYGGVNDVFVGIITLCVTLALNAYFGQTAGDQYKIGSVKLGGYNGMVGIPTLSFGDYKLKGTAFYFVSVIITFIIAFVLLYITHTKSGYTMFAIRENRDRSGLFGYNVPFIQTIVFGIGAAIAALAGILYSIWGNYIDPSAMSMSRSTIPVILVATAGKKSPIGTFIFGFLYLLLSNQFASTGNKYADIILGVLLVVIVLFIPKGVFKAIFDYIDSKVFKKEM